MMGVALATAFMMLYVTMYTVIYLTLRDVYIPVYVNRLNCHMGV